MAEVLTGVRVLDFGRFIAAPWCGALLGDLGAEVIRIEKRGGAEDRWYAPVSTTGDGGMFLLCNRNKRSLTLDPMSPEGREIVKRLVKTADVVIVNLPPQAMTAMGLDYDTLKSIKPDIILTSGSAYGTGGPYSDRVGFDAVGQVMSGGVYRSGTPDQPMKSAISYVDYGTAMCLFSGTLAALFHRAKTGEGQHVEGALLATALMMSNSMLIEQAVIKADRVAVGNRSPNAAPGDLFRVRDGWVFTQVVGDPLFKRWCKLVGEESWASDPRFAGDEMRGQNGAILNDRMQDWCKDMTKAELLAALESARLPGAAMNSPQEALEDPHIQHMKYLHPVDYPGLSTPAPIMETPFRMSLTPGQIRNRAPTPGEHTEVIMKSLGYDDAEIGALRAKNVI